MRKPYWIFEENYKHYRNFQVGGTAFVTTTVLDHVPIFADDACANLMTASLFDDCVYYGVGLWAFVVMPTHVHLLAQLPENQTVAGFVDQMKSHAANRVGKIIAPSMRSRFALQQGLSRRTFWQRGFRSVEIVDRRSHAVKANYIRFNPLKAGLCTDPASYRWSSAWLIESGYGSWDRGIMLSKELIGRFADEDTLDLRHHRDS